MVFLIAVRKNYWWGLAKGMLDHTNGVKVSIWDRKAVG